MLEKVFAEHGCPIGGLRMVWNIMPLQTVLRLKEQASCSISLFQIVYLFFSQPLLYGSLLASAVGRRPSLKLGKILPIPSPVVWAVYFLYLGL